jgi:undecaprenyl-diphosphatase
MATADRVGPTGRRRDEAGFADALALGVAQACALIPGVSRNGMTLAAARLRGFDRADANALSRHVALPVIVGATALKGVRLARRGVPPALASAFAAGVGAAFVSTLASVRIIRAVERDRSFAPYAAYRAALAGVVLRRAWQNRSR